MCHWTINFLFGRFHTYNIKNIKAYLIHTYFIIPTVPMYKWSKVNFYLIWAAVNTNLCLTTNLDISVCCRHYKILILSDLKQSEIYDKLQVCRKMRFNYNKCKIYHLRDRIKAEKPRLKGILSNNQMITNHKSYKHYYQKNKKTSFKLRFLQGYQIKIPNFLSNSKVKNHFPWLI